METQFPVFAIRLALAIVLGSLVGLERSYHGRPAGFRTHTLVCMASALLILVSIYHWELGVGGPMENVRFDPMRMAQGIMTGIGFLGAGVIIKERLTIQGLTTAGSIWITAAIGIAAGTGLYSLAISAGLATIVVLTLFRWVESVLPSMHFAVLTLRFNKEDCLSEEELMNVVKAQVTTAKSSGYHLEDAGRTVVYRLTVSTMDSKRFRQLAEKLWSIDIVKEFDLIQTSR